METYDPNAFGFMPLLCGGGFVLMVIIIFVLVFSRTKKKRQQANNFFPQLAQRTGLQMNGNGLSGMYKGYQVTLRYEVNMNAMSAYKTISTGKSNTYGKHMVFPSLHVELLSPTPFSAFAIYDPPNAFMQTSQFVQDAFSGKSPDWPKLNMDGDALRKGVNFYGDMLSAQKCLNSMELKALLSTWKYPDIRMEGNALKLVLDNNNVAATIGLQKMYTQEFPIQALDIAVATAKAVQS